jgi:hypothetical protein
MSIFDNNYLIKDLEIQFGARRRIESIHHVWMVDIDLPEVDDIHVNPTPTYIDKRGA